MESNEHLCIKGKCEGKVHTRTGHENLEGE